MVGLPVFCKGANSAPAPGFKVEEHGNHAGNKAGGNTDHGIFAIAGIHDEISGRDSDNP